MDAFVGGLIIIFIAVLAAFVLGSIISGAEAGWTIGEDEDAQEER